MTSQPAFQRAQLVYQQHHVQHHVQQQQQPPPSSPQLDVSDLGDFDDESLSSSWDSTTASQYDEEDSISDSFSYDEDCANQAHALHSGQHQQADHPEYVLQYQQAQGQQQVQLPRPLTIAASSSNNNTINSHNNNNGNGAASAYPPVAGHVGKAQLALMACFYQAKHRKKEPLNRMPLAPSLSAKCPPRSAARSIKAPPAHHIIFHKQQQAAAARSSNHHHQQQQMIRAHLKTGCDHAYGSAHPHYMPRQTMQQQSQQQQYQQYQQQQQQQYQGYGVSGHGSIMKPAPRPMVVQTSQLLLIGSDMLVSIVSFMEPPEALRFLTAPLSKQWRQQVTCHQEIWRTLCSSKPFAAIISDSIDSSDDEYSSESETSFCSLDRSEGSKSKNKKSGDQPLGKYRLMYTSFIRCMKYLERIRENARNGRPHASAGAGVGGTVFPHFDPSKSLKKFLARARSVIEQRQRQREAELQSQRQQRQRGAIALARQQMNLRNNHANDMRGAAIGVSDDMASDAAAAAAAMPNVPTTAVAAVAVEDSAPTPGASNRKRNMTGNTNAGAAATAAATAPPLQKKPRFGNSMITSRLLGPTAKGKPGHVNLPISCAIFSIVNWMVGFADVAGIQTMCIKTLPILLEDEQQRLTAQRYNVAEVILRAMVKFPDSVELHTAVFHTMVLLARPLGGREGMLFDNSMGGQHNHPLLTSARGAASTIRLRSTAAANARHAGRGSASVAARPGSENQKQPPTSFNSKSRINILLRSMEKFQSDATLQAMACWAMVNLALSPSLKSQIILQGGIQRTVAAMREHPFHPDVQFRALFALINLVIYSPRNSNSSASSSSAPARTGRGISHGADGQPANPAAADASIGDTMKERTILDEHVDTIATLVVTAMKNFCASETILNRACLVLHNISQSPGLAHRLLWTPYCYQMLEWCITNYPTDNVLRRSAVTTLQRLQVLLSNDDSLRTRFVSFLRNQQETAIGRD